MTLPAGLAVICLQSVMFSRVYWLWCGLRSHASVHLTGSILNKRRYCPMSPPQCWSQTYALACALPHWPVILYGKLFSVFIRAQEVATHQNKTFEKAYWKQKRQTENNNMDTLLFYRQVSQRYCGRVTLQLCFVRGNRTSYQSHAHISSSQDTQTMTSTYQSAKTVSQILCPERSCNSNHSNFAHPISTILN